MSTNDRTNVRPVPAQGQGPLSASGSERAATGGPNSTATWTLKSGLARMLKGGVIMDVVTAEQARIAEEAGAVAVMALERVPADIRAAGGVARMSDPQKIIEIMSAVTIPVMAKCRIGHFVEAQVLEATYKSTTSRCRSCAARAISARRSAASTKARR